MRRSTRQFYVDIFNLDNTVSLEENTLTANQIDAAYQWWDCNNEIFVTGEQGQSFTPSIAGLYSVFITYGDCNVWSDCILSSPLSVEENESNKISFFPNPAPSAVTIQNKLLQKINKIEIIDLSGKIVLQQHDNTGLINIEKLGSGMYILQISLDEQILAHKLVKQ